MAALDGAEGGGEEGGERSAADLKFRTRGAPKLRGMGGIFEIGTGEWRVGSGAGDSGWECRGLKVRVGFGCCWTLETLVRGSVLLHKGRVKCVCLVVGGCMCRVGVELESSPVGLVPGL